MPAGGGGYDMGARRFGPDLGAFLQQDQFAGALADLGLALDPLTQNRYALAGGNPISYVELDGHIPAGCDAQCTRDYAAAANAAAQARALADTANNTPTETRAGRGGPSAAGAATPMSPGVETVCEKIGACPLKLDDKGQRLGLCGVDPEVLQSVLTNKEGVSAWPTQCFTQQTGWRVVRTEDGAFVLAPNTTPGILKSEGGGGSGSGGSGAGHSDRAPGLDYLNLPDEVKAEIDDAIRRAAAGKTTQFYGHDGKQWLNDKGELPARNDYTEWTAAGPSSKLGRAEHRVIIAGDPAHPDAIYYWDHVNPPIWIGP